MITKYPVVYVQWSDVTGNWQWCSIEEAKLTKAKECETTGFLITEDEIKIVMAASHCIADGDVMDFIAIPKVLVQKIVYLEEKCETK